MRRDEGKGAKRMTVEDIWNPRDSGCPRSRLLFKLCQEAAMTQMESIRTYLVSLEWARLEDDGVFTALLVRGASLLEIQDEEIAKEFGVSIPIAHGWTSGLITRPAALRRSVYSWLMKKAETVLTQQEPDEDSAPVRTESLHTCIP